MTQKVFVLSTGRTGTKFLAEYFNANYDSVLALHEPKPSYRLRLYSNAYVDGRLSAEMLISAYRADRRRILETLVAPIYIEATGYLYGFVDVLDRLADNPIILHILRDPREFVRSAHNHGSHSGLKWLVTTFLPYWYPPVRRVLEGRRLKSSIGLSSAKWLLINRKLLESGPRHHDYHLIRFEDLFDEANTGLRRICEILGLDFAERGRVAPSEKVNKGRLQKLEKWSRWTVEQCRELQEICSPLMQQYGYGQEPEWLERVTGQA